MLHSVFGICGQAPSYPGIGLTDIQGMDVYVEESALHAVLVGKPAQRDDYVVAYMVSRDGGGHWSKPVLVSRAQDGKVLSRRGNDAQVAAAGRRVAVVWRKGGALPGVGPMLVAYSADGGATWRRGTNPAAGDAMQNQSYPDLVADRAGRFHLVWLDDRDENGDSQGLRYARSSDGGWHWRGDITLDASVCTCCWNRLAVLPGQRLAALYRDNDPHDMRLALGSADGKTWHDRGAVGAFDWRFNGCPHCGGGIAAEPSGKLHGVVWSGKENAEGLYYLHSTDAARHWAAPLRIGDGRSRESDIAVLGQAHVAVVFTAPTQGGDGVQVMQSNDGGKHWSWPRLLSAPGTAADHPRIVASRNGFRVFWTERDASGAKVWATSLLDR